MQLEEPRTLQVDESEQLDESTRRDTMTINMGPQHPRTHGVLRLVLTLDGETISRRGPTSAICIPASRRPSRTRATSSRWC